MFSVVITEVIQFCILSIASFAVGIIAMAKVTPEMLLALRSGGLGQHLLRLAPGSGLVAADAIATATRSHRTATGFSDSS